MFESFRWREAVGLPAIRLKHGGGASLGIMGWKLLKTGAKYFYNFVTGFLEWADFAGMAQIPAEGRGGKAVAEGGFGRLGVVVGLLNSCG